MIARLSSGRITSSENTATQSEWGERQRPADAAFRGYAAELGLDMARWDADYVSPATVKRIQTDLDDARALGLTSTPSLFLNGQSLQPESVEDLTRTPGGGAGSIAADTRPAPRPTAGSPSSGPLGVTGLAMVLVVAGP
jgi:hypothetical protein